MPRAAHAALPRITLSRENRTSGLQTELAYAYQSLVLGQCMRCIKFVGAQCGRFGPRVATEVYGIEHAGLRCHQLCIWWPRL
jgi:hypothetical protein